MNLLFSSVSVSLLVFILAIFNHSQHKPRQSSTPPHHNNHLQSFHPIAMPYQPLNMMEEQIIEEKRVFYGIGGAGNFRKQIQKNPPPP
jgi:hypothetical protein